jgi:hypothetical protein
LLSECLVDISLIQERSTGKVQRKLYAIVKAPKKSCSHISDLKLEIVGYSDADFAGCVDSRKSTSGYIFTLRGGELFHGKAPNKPWLHHQLCKLSMWHVMKH